MSVPTVGQRSWVTGYGGWRGFALLAKEGNWTGNLYTGILKRVGAFIFDFSGDNQAHHNGFSLLLTVKVCNYLK